MRGPAAFENSAASMDPSRFFCQLPFALGVKNPNRPSAKPLGARGPHSGNVFTMRAQLARFLWRLWSQRSTARTSGRRGHPEIWSRGGKGKGGVPRTPSSPHPPALGDRPEGTRRSPDACYPECSALLTLSRNLTQRHSKQELAAAALPLREVRGECRRVSTQRAHGQAAPCAHAADLIRRSPHRPPKAAPVLAVQPGRDGRRTGAATAPPALGYPATRPTGPYARQARAARSSLAGYLGTAGRD